jgi:hypothetical protein
MIITLHEIHLKPTNRVEVSKFVLCKKPEKIQTKQLKLIGRFWQVTATNDKIRRQKRLINVVFLNRKKT